VPTCQCKFRARGLGARYTGTYTQQTYSVPGRQPQDLRTSYASIVRLLLKGYRTRVLVAYCTVEATGAVRLPVPVPVRVEYQVCCRRTITCIPPNCILFAFLHPPLSTVNLKITSALPNDFPFADLNFNFSPLSFADQETSVIFPCQL
jgi:hypothetical protein